MPGSTRFALLAVLSAAAVAASACADSGATLPLGQQAVIPYDDSIYAGTLGVTVTAIEPGDQAA